VIYLHKLVIIGAGGFGRSVAWLVDDINNDNKKWDLIGFIDENKEIHGQEVNGYPVLGDFSYFSNKRFKEPIFAACAVSNPYHKANLVRTILDHGLRFTNLVHPSVKMSRFVTMGNGNIICADTIINVNAIIGNYVSINPKCGIGHDVVIKDYCTLYWDINLSGYVQVKAGCEIGTKATVIPEVTIGEWSVIGAGAVVVRDIPPHCTAVGVPAKPIKFHEINFEQME
jgi:sugar O-acyltransferase (sialic acid O-acetyltransferase NeuD family)